jgi:hypothetical protein
MTYFPLYIPIYNLTGGGGGPGKKGVIAILLLYTFLIGGLYYFEGPKIKMKIQKKDNDNNYYVEFYKKNYPDIKSTKHYNLDCLYKKNYYFSKIYNFEIDNWWTQIGVINNVKDKNLKEDCQECNVYTEIKYKHSLYPQLSDDNEKRNYTKKFYWHKCLE